jgi:hypothetical protein
MPAPIWIMKKFRVHRGAAGETEMEETQGKKKRPEPTLRKAPITQDQIAALLDVTPRAINEMRKRGVLPAPTTSYPVAWTDRKALAAALREIGVLGQIVAIQIERGAL